jgi:hypothetical protein
VVYISPQAVTLRTQMTKFKICIIGIQYSCVFNQKYF